MSDKPPIVNRERRFECRLFVGNLSYAASRDEIRALFAPAGRVVDVFFPKSDPAAGKVNAGYAFVEMGSASEAERALLMIDNTEGPYGRVVYVKPSNPSLP